MPRGWAGSQATGEELKCAICLQRDRASRAAVTQIMGTLVCLFHVRWLPIAVSPPSAEDE